MIDFSLWPNQLLISCIFGQPFGIWYLFCLPKNSIFENQGKLEKFPQGLNIMRSNISNSTMNEKEIRKRSWKKTQWMNRRP